MSDHALMTSELKPDLSRVVHSMRWFGSVFNLLASIGGAHESMRADFVHHHARSNPPCDEYRFQGKLGFGGKYRRKTNTVDCYSEDETPERLAIIERLNAELAKLPNDKLRHGGENQ